MKLHLYSHARAGCDVAPVQHRHWLSSSQEHKRRRLAAARWLSKP